MAERQLNRVVVKEFPAEVAGEMAGWVDIKTTPGRKSDLIWARVAYGRIAVGGAQYSYPISESGTRGYSSGDSSGFTECVELGLMAPMDWSDIVTESNKAPGLQGLDLNKDRRRAFASSFRYEDLPDKDKGVWVLGAREILSTIKEGLEKQRADWLYANIYYMLAYMAQEEDILPDPSMQDQTDEELAKAQSASSLLAESQQLDTMMQHRLTIFGDIPAVEIPEVFVDSRRLAHRNERTLRALDKDMILGRQQMPIGARSGGRSWPYMDAGESNEDKAFGVELEALRRNDIQPAWRELKREIVELNMRFETSHAMVGRLGHLATLERNSGSSP
ncbi:hypothetical protein COU91_00865 [Candidatus Saccharibacteria bacterium CG10_big_fil_rev_8_21_14_0_10_47_8]|nr:MAG: hypothetical protein COU91_00865 [Candidatus Saccharibacteria bacterium CG10_big_fil_rev_8_21_14_0_10_47_8]